MDCTFYRRVARGGAEGARAPRLNEKKKRKEEREGEKGGKKEKERWRDLYRHSIVSF